MIWRLLLLILPLGAAASCKTETTSSSRSAQSDSSEGDEGGHSDSATVAGFLDEHDSDKAEYSKAEQPNQISGTNLVQSVVQLTLLELDDSNIVRLGKTIDIPVTSGEFLFEPPAGAGRDTACR